MQVKKFEAPTMAEALKLVKSELGPEAIILSTKNNRKGFGLLSGSSVEVTAAVSEKALAKKQITEKVVPPTTREQIGKLPAKKQSQIFDEFAEHYTRRAGDRRARRRGQEVSEDFGHAAAPETEASRRYIDITDDEPAQRQPGHGYGRNGRLPARPAAERSSMMMERESMTREPMAREPMARESMARESIAHEPMARESFQRPASRPAAPQRTEEEFQALQSDMQRLKSMLEEIKTEQLANVDARIPEATSEELHVEYQNLLHNGIDKRHATALIKQVAFTLNREALHDSDRIVEALAIEMMNGLKVDQPVDFKPSTDRRVFAFIGPTGVGKTTTIAKLASQAILQRNLRVGLINVDSYKVAALDQLATYAKILNVPFRQASNATELDRALAEFKPLDLVLIDTSGRSQRDSESLSQMKTLLSECAAVRPVLIMSATTRDQELYDIINRFKIFNPTGLIFSKLDETSTFGCIYNVALKTKLPLCYFTVGQRVPEDLEAASRERVADLILDL